ncbi:MAG TPA: DMT family transporter [Hyphomicrobiaceae bacterium]|nr:DMT family transporter [Hyphomicrobiaceae bacterium]
MTSFNDLLVRAAPLIFMFLWSTGWISARAAIIDCDPITFLAVRFGAAMVVFGAIVAIVRSPFPTTRAGYVHAVLSGFLLHTCYLAGVWYAIGQGVPAGVSAVIAATQPIMTAVLAPMLVNERITARQWAGLVLGFGGIIMVLMPRLAVVPIDSIGLWQWAIGINLFAMLTVTLGTFYQKRFVPTGDLRTTAFLQYLSAFPTTIVLAWMIEPMKFTVSLTSMATLAWSVLAISLGAGLLLLWLIRHGAVSRAANLIYLVPPTAALQAWVLFGETLTPLQMVGIAITVAGVALTVQRVAAR